MRMDDLKKIQYHMNTNYSINSGNYTNYNSMSTGTSAGTQYPITGNLHGTFVTNSYTDGNITISYEIIKLMHEEIKKLSNREKEIINNNELINKLIKEKKIKIIIEIPEEEMI